MEKRLQIKINEFFQQFKLKIIEKQNDQNFNNFINNYPNFILTKSDFTKRKRVKNIVPLYERCIAKRACGEQCTRRKKKNEMFCGTHIKGSPHGTIDSNNENANIMKITIWQQEIQGIIHYIDDNNNVYCTEDIYKNDENPKIIAKYELKDGIYSIPCFK